MNGLAAITSFLGDLGVRLPAHQVAGAIRWFLVVTFLVAGVTKLRRPMLAAIAIAEFGLAKKPAKAQGVALGLLEGGLALWMASGIARALALAVVTSTLCLFAFLIGRSLRAGHSFPCQCFGNSDATLSRSTLVRAVLLGSTSLLGMWLVLLGHEAPIYGWRALMLQFSAGIAMAGSVALLATVPRLMSWNSAAARVVNS